MKTEKRYHMANKRKLITDAAQAKAKEFSASVIKYAQFLETAAGHRRMHVLIVFAYLLWNIAFLIVLWYPFLNKRKLSSWEV